jgi:iron complex outermembrane receptor protein
MLRVRSGLVLLLLATAAFAGQVAAQATGTVSGRILNATTQQPLAFATVRIADLATRTTADGRFVLTGVGAGSQTLRANLVGFREVVDTVSVASGQTTNVDITMEQVPFELDAVVVTGYGEQEKRDVTGVVAEIPAESFNTGRVVAPEELIRGKVAGVQVTESNGGEPGGGMSIRIRGGTSITSSNEPLYVIDGVPIPVGGGLSAGRNPLNFLNPEDIASFTVLKDASATAIYGSQGANGVILIETRGGKGTAAGWGISYTGTLSSSTVAGRPDVLSAAEFRQAVAEFAPAQETVLGDATTDWVRAIEQTGIGQEHTFVVSGGGEKTSLRASLGFLGQKGVVQASRNERLSLNVAFNQLLFDDRLSLQANMIGSRNEDEFTDGLVVGAATNYAPTQPIFDSTSVYGGYFEWDNTLAGVNPLGHLSMVTSEGTTYRSIGNVTGEYALPFLEGLSATARAGYVVTSAERRFFAPSNNKNQVNRGLNGTVNRSNPTELGTLFDGFLTYAGNWNRHGLTVTGGYAFTQRRQDNPFFEAQQLSSDLLGPDGIPTAGLYRNTLFVEESKLGSYFGRANYSFRDRYLLTASVRTDGSSKFGEGNQWGTFPSAAVAWRLSEEPFLAGGTFSDLKLRLSWGKNGNQAFQSYQQYKSYTYSNAQAQVQFGDEFFPTIRPSAADPNIKWEETTSWNFGLDYGLWNNRLTGALEYYTKTTDDLIFTVLVPSGVNLSNVVTTNVGSMKNNGFELTLNALLAEGAGGGFSWDASLNLARNKNELVRIDPFAGGTERILSGDPISGGVGSFIQVLEPGQPVNSFFVYEHKRDEAGNPIWEDNNGLDADGAFTGVPDGTINEQDLYVDANGVINQDDRMAFHKPAPDWIMGFTSSMRFGGFDLGLTLLAQVGNYVYNNVASNTGHYLALTNSARPNNLHSSVLEYGFETPQYFSDVYVENASFLRLENIALGYTFRNALRGVRLFGVVQNAFTITGYSGVDPASSITGIDNNRYPRTRTFTAGLNVTF